MILELATLAFAMASDGSEPRSVYRKGYTLDPLPGFLMMLDGDWKELSFSEQIAHADRLRSFFGLPAMTPDEVLAFSLEESPPIPQWYALGIGEGWIPEGSGVAWKKGRAIRIYHLFLDTDPTTARRKGVSSYAWGIAWDKGRLYPSYDNDLYGYLVHIAFLLSAQMRIPYITAIGERKVPVSFEVGEMLGRTPRQWPEPQFPYPLRPLVDEADKKKPPGSEE